MKMIKLLAKKHIKEILELLNKNEEMYFGQILRIININQSNLSKLLNELVNAGLVEKWEEKEGYKLPKSYYKITKKGRQALIFYKLDDKFKDIPDNQFLKIQNIVAEYD
ncbi:winged helix-turn-helix domain-containing protein [Methanothermococcus okinawensis]|nr:winged helix-turn-helix domain-containing protein [Methanothermococcus okinawensis]